jgi:poly-gamma-glutamate synthesis protein (capsule biosynthesis protein)
MKDEGAEAIVMFIHWGVEYKLKPNNTQKKIAQKLCDLDVDVIIGGHPHVIQPLEILKSKDGNQIVCLYSTGNAVSNQRIYRASIKTGHTEDGILFTATFSKYSDGMVKVTGLDALPTWVHLYDKNGRDVFQIVPLDKKLDWKQDLGLQNSENGVDNAKKSYDRTIALVKDGLDEFKRIA